MVLIISLQLHNPEPESIDIEPPKENTAGRRLCFWSMFYNFYY